MRGHTQDHVQAYPHDDTSNNNGINLQELLVEVDGCLEEHQGIHVPQGQAGCSVNQGVGVVEGGSLAGSKVFLWTL